MQEPLHPATRIARAMAISCQAVCAGLVAIPPAGTIAVQGESRDGWRFDDLPIDWKLEITRRGVKRGFENGPEFLAKMPEPWKCPIPWGQLSVAHQRKAVQLKKALARALQMLGSDVAAATIESSGINDFKQEFGYPISDRHWRRLFHRTIERDAGEENWQCPELYINERAFIARKQKPESLLNEQQHRPLLDVFAILENQQDPTAGDRAVLWDSVFRHYEEHTSSLPDSPLCNRQRKLFKQSLIDYLFKAFPAPILCASLTSLKRRFDEKIALWRAQDRNPQALLDGRAESSGRIGRKLCAKCRPLVIGGAVDLDGDLSQAWRRLQLGKKLCTECAGIGAYDVRRAKSEVLKSVRKDVEPDILTALPHRRGPKHVRLVSPYVRRNWNDIGPGDWAECDDMTPNQAAHSLVEVLTWDQDAQGEPYVGRMEVLFQIDRRTDYPWGYIIILGDPATELGPQRKASYSSVHCRLLFLHAHDKLGLPHHGGGYVLENGVWASRLIDGQKLQKWGSSSWQSVEMGLKDPRIGLSIRHALPGNPRSKVIERVFMSIQSRMRCHPGFLGFNERQDKREVASDFLSRVKAGKEHPGNMVPPVSEFRDLLDAELMAYAAEPQNGNRLPGVSPMEAFRNGIGGKPGIKERPLRQLWDDARFLLSTHERLVPVTAQGIKFNIGPSEFVFWGPELEPFQHREIIARFNFEEPELLTCQAPDGKPFTVKAKIQASTTATAEQLSETAKARASWTKKGKILYDSLPHPFRTVVSHETEQNRETREVGRFQNAEMKKFRAEKTEVANQTARVRNKLSQAGIDASGLRPRNPARAAEAAERIADRLAELKRKEVEAEI